MQRLSWFVALGLLIGCQPPTSSSSTPAGSTTGSKAPETVTASQTDSEEQPSEPTSDPQPATSENLPASGLTVDEIAAGWIRLFDGETLFGWKPNSELNWRVENGVIVADEGQPGLLQTTSRYADYELRCDFRIAEGGNSGIFLRSAFIPSDPGADCYELNICDSHPQFKSGSLVKRVQPDKEITANVDWHTFHVIAQGNLIQVSFDGESILVFRDESAEALKFGHIGLQMNGGKAEFKNVFLRPLSRSPLFNGTDLTGWTVVPGSKSQFEVQDATIHVTGGRGFLQTEAAAKNFVFQFDAKTNGDKLNSGVFFRAMPGTEAEPSNGYEYQIQNGYQNDDRTKPDDFGTGAIFRRIAARQVISNDREWFTATLIADGPHFATWVNGYPVVDWTDDRPADENPRKGLRLEAGHFSLQGHDPGTDLNFRNIQLSPLPD